MKASGNGACLGYRPNGKGPYEWISYLDVIERVRFIGSGLLNKGVQPVNSTNVAIYSKNRPEWSISEYACYTYSLNVVSLYDSYGKESIKYILNQAEISVAFVDGFERVKNVAQIIDELPYMKLVIYFDDFNSQQLTSLKVPSSVELISFKDLMLIGRANIKSPVPPKPSDNATICYTSGTTGVPKGAVITHGNMVSNEAANYKALNKPHLKIPGADSNNPQPVVMCYLPLAHMLERMSCVKHFTEGARIGFISGDILSLLDDCKELKPTNIPMVPRLLNKLYDRVTSEIGNNKIKMVLFKRAIAAKEADRKRGIVSRDTIYDKLIFAKIRDIFGGNICRTATGSAPISREVMEFARSAFSCILPEGYGQTEATATVTMCHPFEPEVGHCGPPVESVMLKLVDVPEMDYCANDGKGEICIKGPSVFKEYYKEPEKTAEVFDKDGWLHTGDIGMWLPNGCLKIIDRKKNIFKLSQGEYISPEKIENIYLRSLFVAQIFVDGDSMKDSIIGIVVPEEAYLMDYCKKHTIKGTFKELCRNENVKKLIIKDLNKIAMKMNLMPYEKVKNIYLFDELFSLENGLATPTLKLKRVDLRKHFKDVIGKLYEEMPKAKSKI